MPDKSDDTKVDKYLERIQTDLPLGTERTFLQDLREAVLVQSKLVDIPRAPYVDPTVRGVVRPAVKFPDDSGEYLGSAFALMVRPQEGQRSSEAFYGVPIWLGNTVSLGDSGLLERKIDTWRLGKEHDSETDKLTRILRGKSATATRAKQDLFVDLTVADLLKAYEEEDGTTFSGIQVQRAKAVVPTNPAYQTEAVGLVSNCYALPTQHTCFGYGIGGTFYRGRPILQSSDSGSPRLVDINEHSEEAYFNITALSALRGKDVVNDPKVGNMVIIALPLVGEQPRPVHDLFESQSPALTLGGGMKGGGTFGLDRAVFSTGRATGGSSRLVSGRFDTDRKVSIIDLEILALTPEQIPDAIKGLPQ